LFQQGNKLQLACTREERRVSIATEDRERWLARLRLRDRERMARQGVASMFAMALLLGVFASILQSDYLSLSLSLLFACMLKKKSLIIR